MARSNKRAEALEALRRAAPEGWRELSNTDRQWELVYASPHTDGLLFLSAYAGYRAGTVEVSGDGCTIKCGPENAKAAVQTVVAWMHRRQSSGAREQRPKEMRREQVD